MGGTDHKTQVFLGRGCLPLAVLFVLVGVIACSYWYTHQPRERQKQIQAQAGLGLDKTAHTIEEATSGAADRLRKADWTRVTHTLSNVLQSSRSNTARSETVATNVTDKLHPGRSAR